jgi:hypothetical protein
VLTRQLFRFRVESFNVRLVKLVTFIAQLVHTNLPHSSRCGLCGNSDTEHDGVGIPSISVHDLICLHNLFLEVLRVIHERSDRDETLH